MDRFLAFLLIIILTPFLLILLLVTFLDMKCNPVFIQIRTVSGDKEFKFYKIRSMRKMAPNVPTSDFKNVDLYITRWGRILRLYSLDELLNLICIVNGNMKFIGPRPIMPCESNLVSLRSKNGIDCMPGITGLAQINGRDLITVHRKVACERYYNRKKSSLNLRKFILYKTVLLVIKKTGITH
jgi:O-antigen biosynthesis protein WbqP